MAADDQCFYRAVCRDRYYRLYSYYYQFERKGKDVNALKATLISFALLIGFFYAGDMMLKLFHVDIESFAVAGAFVIFLMSLEMILDIEIFKNQGPIKEATLVPLVFPLLAGAGALPLYSLCVLNMPVLILSLH